MKQGQYLRGMLRRTATQVRGIISAPRPDGSYYVIREDTGGKVIAAVGVAGASFSVGQFVTMSIPDGSGVTVGTGYSIIATPNVRSVTSTVASRYTSTIVNTGETFARIVVGGVNVSLVQLTHGGAAVTIQIYGARLVTPATYGNAGITDNVAQVFTADTLLTIQVKASGATPLGRYSLTVAGQTIPNFFEIL